MSEDYKKWLMQYRKGYIELCVLITLKNKSSMNGIAFMDFFEEKKLFINEGTLYPLLNRMEQNGLLNSKWKLPEQKGHPKKEYSVSKKGEELLPLIIESYEAHHKSLISMKGKNSG